MVIDKPQKVEIQKIDSMVVLIWPGDLMLTATYKLLFVMIFSSGANFGHHPLIGSNV